MFKQQSLKLDPVEISILWQCGVLRFVAGYHWCKKLCNVLLWNYQQAA